MTPKSKNSKQLEKDTMPSAGDNDAEDVRLLLSESKGAIGGDKLVLTIRNGLQRLTSLALPIITTAAIQVGQNITTLAFIGRLDSAKFMGGMTLGNMCCNITGFSLSYGLLTALDVLISQAYGAQMYTLMGLHAQRAIVILSLCTIPVIIIWSYTGEFLHFVLGIDYDTSMLAGEWANLIRYGLWPALVFDIFRKFLQGQQIVWPVVVAALCSLVLNVFLNQLLVVKYKLGFRGAGLSQVICQWVSLVILILIILARKWYVLRSSNVQESRTSHTPLRTLSASTVVMPTPQADLREHMPVPVQPDTDTTDSSIATYKQPMVAPANAEDNWPPLSMRIFQDWSVFLALGIPGAFSLLLEWGSYEAIASIAGTLGEVGLATHGIFMSTAGVLYLAPAAIATATATLAGNRLGDNDADGAKYFIKLGLWVDFCWGILAGLFLVLILRPYWGLLYTNDEHVQSMVYATLPIMLLYTTVDSTKCITLNVLRSTGRPGITVVGNVVSCLCVMLPLGYYLVVIKAYGVRGLWFAMSMAWLIATCYYLYVVVTTDWQSQADLARQRNDKAQELAKRRIGGDNDNDNDKDNDEQQQQLHYIPTAAHSGTGAQYSVAATEDIDMEGASIELPSHPL